jgi:purine nucleosidase
MCELKTAWRVENRRQQSNGWAAGYRVFGMKSLRALLVLFAFSFVVFIPASRSQAAAPSAKVPSSPQLVIIDTDIGDDIDDAFALALALRSPELKVLGVTTTFGNTELRARLVDRYLKAYAKRDTDRQFGNGAEFILRAARQHPGEVTLIGIGPLFTVEAAIKRDPATFKKLKRVVIMGGSVYRGYGLDSQGKPKPPEPEWNILNDPSGLKALLASGVSVFMMPLDSTQVPLETQGREAIFAHGSALTDQLTLLYHEWIGGTASHSPTPTLFDPVAVTYTFRPDICPAKPMHIDVNAKGMTTPGQGAPNAGVCLQSDEKGFLDLLLKRVTTD